MSVGPIYLKLRQALRRDMRAKGTSGVLKMKWTVTDISHLTGISEGQIEYTFIEHENHLKRYVLVYDPQSRTVHWNN